MSFNSNKRQTLCLFCTTGNKNGAQQTDFRQTDFSASCQFSNTPTIRIDSDVLHMLVVRSRGGFTLPV